MFRIDKRPSQIPLVLQHFRQAVPRVFCYHVSLKYLYRRYQSNLHIAKLVFIPIRSIQVDSPDYVVMAN